MDDLLTQITVHWRGNIMIFFLIAPPICMLLALTRAYKRPVYAHIPDKIYSDIFYCCFINTIIIPLLIVDDGFKFAHILYDKYPYFSFYAWASLCVSFVFAAIFYYSLYSVCLYKTSSLRITKFLLFIFPIFKIVYKIIFTFFVSTLAGDMPQFVIQGIESPSSEFLICSMYSYPWLIYMLFSKKLNEHWTNIAMPVHGESPEKGNGSEST